MTKQIEILEKNNTQLNSAYKEMAKMSHDFNNQIRTICTMAADTDNKELQEYTRDLVKDLEDIKIITYTGIDSIDAVINRKQKQAQENDITMNISVTPFETVGIRNIDLCVILANLFDNAIEACERIRIKEDRYINFKFSKVGDMIVIKIDNSFDYNLSIKAPNGKLLTTKTEAHFHGYGLKIIDSIVEKYSGIIETKHNEDVFTVNVMLDD